MNRRGRPEETFSTCATNSKRTVQELKQEIKARKAKQFSAEKSTSWNFNPLASPHMGKVCQDADGVENSRRKWEQIVAIIWKRWLSGYLLTRVLADKSSKYQKCSIGNTKGGQLATRKVVAW